MYIFTEALGCFQKARLLDIIDCGQNSFVSLPFIAGYRTVSRLLEILSWL